MPLFSPRRRRFAPPAPWSVTALAALVFLTLTSLKKDASSSIGAASFNGTNQRLGIVDAVKYRFGITAAWCLMIQCRWDTLGTTTRFFEKGTGATGDVIVLKNTSDQISITVGPTGNAITIPINTPTIRANTPYTFFIENDPVAQTVTAWHSDGITLTASAAISTAAISYTPGTAALSLGAGAAGTQWLPGRMGNVAKWDRKLTAGERTSLINLGNGFLYSDVAGIPGLSTSLSWWYSLGTADGGTLLGDRLSGDALTNTGTVPETGGNQSTAATVDGETVKYSANGGTDVTVTYTQPTTTRRPTLKIVNGKQWMLFNGSQWLDAGTSATTHITGNQGQAVVVQTTGLTNGMCIPLPGSWWNGSTEGIALVVAGTTIALKERAATPLVWSAVDASTTALAYLNDGNPHLVYLERTGSNYHLWVDGVRRASGIASTLNASAVSTNWGAQGNGGGTPYIGYAAQPILRATILTEQERVNLQRQVMTTYGVTTMRLGYILGAQNLSYAGGHSPTITKTADLSLGNKTVLVNQATEQLRVFDGNLYRVGWWSTTPTTGDWYVQVRRYVNATTYTLVDERGPFVCQGTGLQIRDLDTPLNYQHGKDRLCFVIPASATIGTVTQGAYTILSRSGHAGVGDDVFSADTANSNFACFAWGRGPKVRYKGDSLTVGHGTGRNGGHWGSHYETAWTTDDPTASFAYRLYELDPRLTGALYALGGQSIDWVLSTGQPDSIAGCPDAAIDCLEIGVNDTNTLNRNWAALSAKFDSYYNAQIAANPTMPIVVFNVPPATSANDTQAGYTRDVNAGLQVWASDKPLVHLIDIYTPLGVLRPSTGHLDNLNPLCDSGDLIHWNYTGVDVVAGVSLPVFQSLL